MQVNDDITVLFEKVLDSPKIGEYGEGMKSFLYRWKVNVWRNRSFLRTGEWKYYYCSVWCFLTDQQFCKKGK